MLTWVTNRLPWYVGKTRLTSCKLLALSVLTSEPVRRTRTPRTELYRIGRRPDPLAWPYRFAVTGPRTEKGGIGERDIIFTFSVA